MYKSATIIEDRISYFFKNYSFGGLDSMKFMDILKRKKITSHFQPIISLKNAEVLGYEALSRGPIGSIYQSPINLFNTALKLGKLWDLELLCREKAFESIASNNYKSKIFINVDPNIIYDEKFRKGFTKEFLRRYNINPENVVFEITEKNTVTDIHGFKKVIDNYKDQGYKIAIDDTGSGYSGLKLITDIHPHYIKLDMDLVRNIDKDKIRFALIKALCEFCKIVDILVIAEGIETFEELSALKGIGVDYGQGYFIKRPSSSLDEKEISIY